MKIYKISQNVNNDYDTYDSAVVYAESEEEARVIHPNGNTDSKFWVNSTDYYNSTDAGFNYYLENWTNLENVKVEYIGEAPHITEKGVILASFNAG